MIQTFTFQPAGADGCYVEAYLHSEWQSAEIMRHSLPAVVICPGGGYEYTSDREGEPVAMEYYHAGYHAFVVHYAVKEHAGNFQPLCQLAAVIAHIRKQAEEWNVQENKIAVCGFSAGGHLAAHYSNAYNSDAVREVFSESKKPNFSVLCYPVISADESFAHRGSFINLLGTYPEGDDVAKYSCDKMVSENTPPAFIWHTTEDQAVPVKNSLVYATALADNKVPFTLRIYPYGVHGLSTVDHLTLDDDKLDSKNALAHQWLDDLKAWMDETI